MVLLLPKPSFWVLLFSTNSEHGVEISSVKQILREINFEECRSSKNAVFAILGVLNIVIFAF